VIGKDEESRGQIAVRVLFFGAARDAVGQSEVTLSLDGPAKAAAAFEQVLTKFPELRRFGRSLLFAINEEYAPADREVRAGDELALFPPVSGGSEQDSETRGRGGAGTRGRGDGETGRHGEVFVSNHDFFELTTEPIDVGAVSRRVVLPECGATVTLDGYAREWTLTLE
jgi:molybdopterin converting factor subunit 1